MNEANSAERLRSLLKLTLELDGLKHVERDNPLSIGDRLELTAEHSWHVAMAVLLWAPESPVPLDVHRAVTLAVVHDFPELFVGDSPVHLASDENRLLRELPAMKALVESDKTQRAKEIFDLWQEYEREDSTEGKFVKAVDMLLPILHNHARLQDSSWVRRRAKAERVRKRIESARLLLPWLADRADEIVAHAVEVGALNDEED